MSRGDDELFWMRRARAVARRINSGWWLDRWNRVLVPLFLVGAGVVLLLRSHDLSWTDGGRTLAALGCLILGGAAVALRISRGRFVDTFVGLVRLDEKLGLKSRLVSASRKVGPWPPRQDFQGQKVTPEWRFSRAVLPTLLSAVVLAGAWTTPLPQRSVRVPPVVNEPAAWQEMEEWLALMKEEDIADPDSLESIAEKIEELKQQPREDWFSHASLEATDTLKDSLGRDLRDLGSDLETLERDLAALQSFSAELPDAARDMLLREFDQALQGLEANSIEINDALASQLRQLDPSQLGKETAGNLSNEEMDSLQQQLGKGAQALGALEGLPGMGEEMMALEAGEFPGADGISQDGGPAPLAFGAEEDLGTRRIEAVDNPDLSKAVIGDLIGVGETEHEENDSGAGIQAGGAVSSPGRGGDAVWREALLPDEKALLRRYFQ